MSTSSEARCPLWFDTNKFYRFQKSTEHCLFKHHLVPESQLVYISIRKCLTRFLVMIIVRERTPHTIRPTGVIANIFRGLEKRVSGVPTHETRVARALPRRKPAPRCARYRLTRFIVTINNRNYVEANSTGMDERMENISRYSHVSHVTGGHSSCPTIVVSLHRHHYVSVSRFLFDPMRTAVELTVTIRCVYDTNYYFNTSDVFGILSLGGGGGIYIYPKATNSKKAMSLSPVTYLGFLNGRETR